MTMRVEEDTKLLDLLNRHPELKQRVRALADIAADVHGDLVRADEAERRVIEEVRRIGQETLHSWAEERIARGEEEQLQADGARRADKKTLLAHHIRNHRGRGTPVSFGNTHTSRPFSGQAQVTNRCCSQPLQRAVTDFGTDVAFGQMVGKLHEHCGVVLASETIRGIVEGHTGMLEQHALAEAWPSTEGEPQLVAEMDGGLVPIVTVDPESISTMSVSLSVRPPTSAHRSHQPG